MFNLNFVINMSAYLHEEFTYSQFTSKAVKRLHEI